MILNDGANSLAKNKNPAAKNGACLQKDVLIFLCQCQCQSAIFYNRQRAGNNKKMIQQQKTAHLFT
jgi:hypothetical protein